VPGFSQSGPSLIVRGVFALIQLLPLSISSWRLDVVLSLGKSLSSSSYWSRQPAQVRAQGAKQSVPQSPIADADADHVEARNEWFYRGRIVRGKPSAELRRRPYQAKLELRAQSARALAVKANGQPSLSSGSWMPLGPVPVASDASGNGTQDYHQVAGRATAVAIDPADATGNTVYIGGAQAGAWKWTNAANASANSVTWDATDGRTSDAVNRRHRHSTGKQRSYEVGDSGRNRGSR
jgi:hypothetical protein